jgi:hypothetical protein
MYYSSYNNDLPAPPKGYADWRQVYAQALRHLSNTYGVLPPLEATAMYHAHPAESRVSTDSAGLYANLGVFEVPYWQMAHYAAREQAEADQKNPLPSFSDYRTLIHLLEETLSRRTICRDYQPDSTLERLYAYFQQQADLAYHREREKPF